MTVLENASKDENKAIEELRARMINDITPQMYQDIPRFYRFLKARDFNVDQAEFMLRKNLEWRKKFKVDTIQTNFATPEVLAKYYPQCFLGFDKEGSPIRYYAFGNLDAKGTRKSCKFPDIVSFTIQMMDIEEKLIEKQNEKLGKTDMKAVEIIDMKHFSFSSATDKKTGEHAVYFFKMYQDNYPERLKSAYVVNVSPYFQIAFTFLKVFLASTILKKVHILTASQQSAELLKVIDADVLPAFLGGTRTDPDGNPNCDTIVNHGGKIPSTYFLTKDQNQSLAQQEGVKRLVVPRSSHFEIELEVKDQGSYLVWEFEVRCRDVEFGLFLRKKVNGQEETVALVPMLRLETEDFTEEGSYKCDQTGTYVMVFDNSFSWLRSKEIYCRARVVPREEYEAKL